MQQEPDRPVSAPELLHIEPPELDYQERGPVSRLRAWWHSRRQPSQEEYFAPLLQEALAGRLDLRISGGQVIVDDLSGWQERVMTGIREASAEHDPPPDTLYESSLDRMRADSGLGEAQEPDGPRASAPLDTRLEDVSTQNWQRARRRMYLPGRDHPVDIEGRLDVAHDNGRTEHNRTRERGEQLLGLATPRNTTWDRAASDARPDDLPSGDMGPDPGSWSGSPLGDTRLDRGAEFAEGFAGNLDHMREVYGDDEVPVPEYEDAILVPIDRLRTPEEIEALQGRRAHWRQRIHCNAAYWCPETAEIECPEHGGFDTCCAHPEYHWSLDAIEKYLHLRMVQVDEQPARYADGTWHCRRGCDPFGDRQGYATREDYLAAHRCWLSS